MKLEISKHFCKAKNINYPLPESAIHLRTINPWFTFVPLVIECICLIMRIFHDIYCTIFSAVTRAFFKDFPVVGQTNERAHTTSPLQFNISSQLLFAI